MGAPAFLVIEQELAEPGNPAFGDTGKFYSSAGNIQEEHVRRPMRGIRLKRETYATLRVDGAGTVNPVLNSSVSDKFKGLPNFTSNFILQSVQESRREKFQSLNTFGAPYGFFFGEQPQMMQFTAILLNTADFQWEVEWWENYQNVLRGTALTDRGLRVYLTFDDVVVEGYITGASTTKSASDPYQVQLAFSMWVTDTIYMITPGESKISSRHLESGSLGNELDDGFQDIESRREALSGASTTAAVRAANIRAVASTGGIGLLGKLRAGVAAVSGFVGEVGNSLANARDFLYGRNMVIPRGFAGSEVLSGHPVFASGSGAENLIGERIGGILSGVSFGGNQPGSTISIRVPGLITGVARSPSDFADNIDEYPARGSGAGRSTPAVLNENPDPREDDLILTRLAEAAFSGFGQVTDRRSPGVAELGRKAGRAAFAALSYAAMTTGASQTAASLTVGNVTARAAADREQAAGEALP
jgi:hypothetical protein